MSVPESWTERPRSVSLIDGAWLASARAKIVPDDKWDLLEFANLIVPRHHWRFRTYYFHSLPFKERFRPDPQSVADYEAMRDLFRRIGRLERFTVRVGYCQKKSVRGELYEPPSLPRLVTVQSIEQKMVDVLLATEMTRIAWSKEALHIVLVAGDSDYVSAVEAAKGAGALVRLCYFKMGDTNYGQRLYDAVDERLDLLPIFEKMKNAPSPSAPPPPMPAPGNPPTPRP